jgi:hypothetical protein
MGIPAKASRTSTGQVVDIHHEVGDIGLSRPQHGRRDQPVHFDSEREAEQPAEPAEYYRSTDLVALARGRIDGLRLVAADGPFTTGSGPLVSGTTVALILAMTGRTTYCDELEGDGVATLRERGGTP